MSRRCWLVPVAMVAVLLLSACQYNPYRWPRPGQPSATALESQLNERDPLQDAARDLIALGTAMRDAVQRAYPATQWASTSEGVQANCAPPFVFLSGSVFVLPRWESLAPTPAAEQEAVVAAAADVLKAHHAEKIDLKPRRSASGVFRRERGQLQFTIMVPHNDKPPKMTVTGTTGCHHVGPGPVPWNTSTRPAPPPPPTPPPASTPASTPPPANTPASTPPP